MSIANNDLGNSFWLPSTIMQSIAAMYAVFIAIFLLTIQQNQMKLSSVADVLKPAFKHVSYIIFTCVFLNGLIILLILVSILI